MPIQQITFKSKLDQFQQKNAVTFSSKLTQQPPDKIEISTKKDEQNISEKTKKKGTFEKVSLGVLAVATLTGIGLFAFRKNIAKNIWYQPEEHIKPLKGLKDDTLEQAAECISDKFHNLEFKAKNLEEILVLKKYASSIEHFQEIAKALERKIPHGDHRTIIQEFEPIVNQYFEKVDKLDYYHPSHIAALAYAYNKEGMSGKSYNLLLKAERRWEGENFGTFKSSLIDLYSSNGENEKAIKIWESVSDKEIPNYRRESTCLIPVMNSYIGLGDTESAIANFKKYNGFSNEDLIEVYMNIMLKQKKQKEFINEFFTSKALLEQKVVKFMDKNIDKFEFNDEKKQIIKTMTKSLNAERDLPFSISPFEEKDYENIKVILECTKSLKGKVLPNDYADKMIKILEEILNTSDPIMASKMTDKLDEFRFRSQDEKYPAYQWLKENLTA